MLCVTFLAQCVVKVMLSGLACWFFFLLFFYSKINRSLRLQKWCVLWAGSIAWYIEKKKSCDTVSWLQTSLWQTLCSKPFQQTLEKKNYSCFNKTLEVHIIALNFYDTRLCHIFMDKCNDGCPHKKKEKKYFLWQDE